MSFQDPAAWTVKYDVIENILNASFKSLDFIERFDCGWTIAIHRFAVFGESADGIWRDELLKQLIELGDGDFPFHIEDLSGTKILPTQTHFVIPWDENVSIQGNSVYTICTVEKRAKMHFVGRHAVRIGEISEQVRALVEESGLKIGDIEDTKTPESLHTLHQPGWTNHEFIINHLLPRSINGVGVSGYQLFSNFGDQVSFCTVPFSATNIAPPKEQVRAVTMHTNDWHPILSGGVTAVSHGFDPFKLEKVVGIGVLGPMPNTSIDPALAIEEALRFWLHPDREYEIANIRAASITHRTGWWHHWFSAKLRGDDIIGGAKVPFVLDLSGTKFKDDDKCHGYVIFRHHQVSSSVYDITLNCVQG